MKNRILLILVAAVVWGTLVKGAKQPNIVFILLDDTGWNALDVPADPKITGSGSSFYQTPHTSELALSGIRFSMAYSPAPTCSPTRASIQYGQTPATLGKFNDAIPVNLPAASDTMVNSLKAAFPEYRAAHYGKWHQSGRTPEEVGYDESDGSTKNKEGNEGPADDPKLSFELARKTNNFMKRQTDEGRPFFVQVSFYANHKTYMALPETIRKYEGRKQHATKYQKSPLWAAMHEEMDTAVGSIVETLDQLGIRDNTYIIYTGDNGYQDVFDTGKPVAERSFYKAHPLLSHKYTLSEGGLRVPFIVSGPGIPAGGSSRVPVVGYDIFPTVLAMAGAINQVPANVEGGSILALCKNGGVGTVERRDSFLAFCFSKWGQRKDLAIVQDGYKFLRETDSGKEHLFSLWDDLGEQKNLIAEMPVRAASLRANLNDYFQSRIMGEEAYMRALEKITN